MTAWRILSGVDHRLALLAHPAGPTFLPPPAHPLAAHALVAPADPLDRVAFLDLHVVPSAPRLENFRRQRDDLGETPLAQLARHRAEDARPFRGDPVRG